MFRATLLAVLCTTTTAADERQAALAWLIDASGVGRPPPAVADGAREYLDEVLGSRLFVRAAIGPFELAVMVTGDPMVANLVLEKAAAGLQKIVPVLDEHLDLERGLPGVRQPIVLVPPGTGSGPRPFDAVLALLDACEWTGWATANGALWSDEHRAELVVRTYDVQLIDLAHPTATELGDFFFAHGVGYHALAHVVNRVLRRGSWGNVPPWLANGLIDELDIQAYGDAWVGGDWYEVTTAGWYRPGWSGFLPQGARPPPPPSGPPADLAVTVSKTGDPWAHRANSPERHWIELAADRGSEAPASFAYMAEHQSFLPRDRAYARAVLHLLLELAPSEEVPLLGLLDRPVRMLDNGMPEAEPLPALVSEGLGGVEDVQSFEAWPLAELCLELGRSDLARQAEELLAAERARQDSGREELEKAGLFDTNPTIEPAEFLALADHRAQAQWLFQQPAIGAEARGRLFNVILEAEYYQQLHEWELLGKALDRAADAALRASKTYPKSAAEQKKVATAFWNALRP